MYASMHGISSNYLLVRILYRGVRGEITSSKTFSVRITAPVASRAKATAKTSDCMTT